MHPYYMEKKAKLKKEMDGYLSLISEELEQETGKPYKELLNEVWEYYEANMLENFPYIGGDKASGTKNLTGAYAYVALGVVCRKYGMTLERWGYLCVLSYQRLFRKIPKFARNLAGKLFGKTNLVIKMLRKKDAKNAANAAENPGSFVTQVQEPTAEYPVIYHTKVCPLADFAAKYGYNEYIPYICNLDYAMFGELNVPFYREHTCADGDGYCDFKMKSDAPVVPAWPCHAADRNDPLK